MAQAVDFQMGLGDIPEMRVSVSDFIDLMNETYDLAFPSIIVSGELMNLRVSKNRWVYFDLKDDSSSLKCFGTVYQLPGPLEDGMLLEVRGSPRMHNLYGFSFNVQAMRPAGEGSIKRASELLMAKLQKEGLFEPARKRRLPYPPARIGLITSGQSAAYADFMKILAARWGGLQIDMIDVQVQGEAAPPQIIAAIERFNGLADPPEILVIIRGGGSADDLAAFSHEQVTRAVAASRVPTLVAIGHEVDVSLAELAADKRASTPSNAAELLTPDRLHVLERLRGYSGQLHDLAVEQLGDARLDLQRAHDSLDEAVMRRQSHETDRLAASCQLLQVLSPHAALKRGYAILRRTDGRIMAGDAAVRTGDTITIERRTDTIQAGVTAIIAKQETD